MEVIQASSERSSGSNSTRSHERQQEQDRQRQRILTETLQEVDTATDKNDNKNLKPRHHSHGEEHPTGGRHDDHNRQHRHKMQSHSHGRSKQHTHASTTSDDRRNKHRDTKRASSTSDIVTTTKGSSRGEGGSTQRASSTSDILGSPHEKRRNRNGHHSNSFARRTNEGNEEAVEKRMKRRSSVSHMPASSSVEQKMKRRSSVSSIPISSSAVVLSPSPTTTTKRSVFKNRSEEERQQQSQLLPEEGDEIQTKTMSKEPTIEEEDVPALVPYVANKSYRDIMKRYNIDDKDIIATEGGMRNAKHNRETKTNKQKHSRRHITGTTTVGPTSSKTKYILDKFLDVKKKNEDTTEANTKTENHVRHRRRLSLDSVQQDLKRAVNNEDENTLGIKTKSLLQEQKQQNQKHTTSTVTTTAATNGDTIVDNAATNTNSIVRPRRQRRMSLDSLQALLETQTKANHQNDIKMPADTDPSMPSTQQSTSFKKYKDILNSAKKTPTVVIPPNSSLLLSSSSSKMDTDSHSLEGNDTNKRKTLSATSSSSSSSSSPKTEEVAMTTPVKDDTGTAIAGTSSPKKGNSKRKVTGNDMVPKQERQQETQKTTSLLSPSSKSNSIQLKNKTNTDSESGKKGGDAKLGMSLACLYSASDVLPSSTTASSANNDAKKGGLRPSHLQSKKEYYASLAASPPPPIMRKIKMTPFTNASIPISSVASSEMFPSKCTAISSPDAVEKSSNKDGSSPIAQRKNSIVMSSSLLSFSSESESESESIDSESSDSSDSSEFDVVSEHLESSQGNQQDIAQPTQTQDDCYHSNYESFQIMDLIEERREQKSYAVGYNESKSKKQVAPSNKSPITPHISNCKSSSQTVTAAVLPERNNTQTMMMEQFFSSVASKLTMTRR